MGRSFFLLKPNILWIDSSSSQEVIQHIHLTISCYGHKVPFYLQKFELHGSIVLNSVEDSAKCDSSLNKTFYLSVLSFSAPAKTGWYCFSVKGSTNPRRDYPWYPNVKLYRNVQLIFRISLIYYANDTPTCRISEELFYFHQPTRTNWKPKYYLTTKVYSFVPNK